MVWTLDVSRRFSAGNAMLFDKGSDYLQDLSGMLADCSHRVVTLWALDLAEGSVGILEERYPDETRPRDALRTSREWAAGRITMRPAQHMILGCHAFAKEIENPEDIAICHAIGQACSVVHTVGHAIGYVIYDLTAVVHRHGIDGFEDAVEDRKREYMDRLVHWEEHVSDHQGDWAGFMLRD